MASINTTENDDYNDTKCPICREMETQSRDYYIAQLVFPICIFIANSLTTVAIYRARRMKLAIRMSLLNLSFTDILASLLYIYHIIYAWTVTAVTIECYARHALLVTSYTLTLSTIMFMSMDRCFSVFLPFRYDRLTNRVYVSVAISCTWILTIVYVIVGFMFLEKSAQGCFYTVILKRWIHVFYGIAGSAAIIAIVIMNTVLFIYARLEISKIAMTLVGVERENHLARLGTKATMTTVSLVVPYVLMNAPMYGFMFYIFFDVKFGQTLDGLFVMNALSSLSSVNSLINPSIYIWRLEPIRFELKKMANPLRVLCQSKLLSNPNLTPRTSHSTVQYVH